MNSSYTQEKQQAIKQKIDALLMKANDPAASEHEKSSIYTKVQELAEKYALGAVQLNPTEDLWNLDDPHRIPFKQGTEAMKLHSHLLATLCKAYGCKMLMETRKPRYFLLYGQDHHIRIVTTLYRNLSAEVEGYIMLLQGDSNRETRALRKGFFIGFVDEIHQRFKSMRPNDFYDKEYLEVSTAVLKNVPTRSLDTAITNVGSMDKGRRAGSMANLAHTSMKNNPRELSS